MKFRKRPVVIEAVQFTNTERNYEELADFMGGVTVMPVNPPHLRISTLEGVMLANVGDWIIRGVAGELYPCKPEIFAATYEPVDADPGPREQLYQAPADDEVTADHEPVRTELPGPGEGGR